MTVEGTGITGRKAAGKAYKYTEKDFSVQEESSKTVDEEKERFNTALETAEEQLEDAAEKTGGETEGDEADIFKAQIQFLKDPQITSGVEESIEEGLTAERSVEKGFEDPIQQLESQEGRMKERADDLRDIRDRLLGILTGETDHGLSDIPENTVIVAENLKPSDTSEMNRDNVSGLVTAQGSRTSHVAILAKSMGIPAVVGTGSIEEIEDGEQLLVDGDTGKVTIDPGQEKIDSIEQADSVEVIQKHVETSDGEEKEVAANVANHKEVSIAAEKGADGIGLYRTEFMFLDREEPPTEEEHLEKYVEALNSFPEERVIVRTIDIGGDKPVPYLDQGESDNPFLGVRGIRLAFEEGEELFKTQLKALLRAAASENGENLALMFPMIATVEEFRKAKEIVDDLEEELENEGKEFDRPEIGLMVETPSAVQMAGELAEEADFLSIGTNDLTQYTMAASRTDSKVSGLQNPLHPAVLRSIKHVVDRGHENDAWVGMCGEMAGNSETTEILVGMGLDEFSMSAGVVPEVKNRLREIDSSKASDKASQVLEAGIIDDVREII
ncbi:phosphoenolpyruvate--protein phosphotransferase [Candidatus Nanohalovita haloferacivicina]|uniref:phosphoenolpyruvate--protein phosphotransferase n=1 Tax=Candidatus Nanohalovita haloferacivicina TaxID=2978046 RepID=UPI00325FAB51|nr:Phosphoenolpyruvate-protein phosphotransferase (PTS system enzyme I) [Candidatus Nanohalobia archaeon BNXNv]